MVLTTFTQPIHAAEVSLDAIADDMSPCCGAFAQDVSTYFTSSHNQPGCPNTLGAHNHTDHYKDYYIQCMNCGTTSYMGTLYVYTYCTHIGGNYVDPDLAAGGGYV